MDWQPSASLKTIQVRARLYQQIRAYFAAQDCLEVDTPLLSASTNTDVNIESIRARNFDADHYLQTSPEFAMKRLLASGSGSIYQICHAFRASERGRRHQSEFTLLEWYRIGFDYQQLMDEMESLIDTLSGEQNQYQRISYADLILAQANVDIRSISLAELRRSCAEQLPGTDSAQLDFDQCLDLLIGLVVEPRMTGYVFVYDYPASQAALARVNADNAKVAERFELFYNGLELANGFSELTDAAKQRARFEADNRQRLEQGLEPYPIDEDLLAALAYGVPECAGVALGLDRLLMVLLGLDSIGQVMTFCE
jgi:lysyl-tRNA synthetase class 2